MNPQVKKHVKEVRKEVQKTPSYFTRGVLQGIGWAFGATIGFAVVLGIVSFVLTNLGHLPFVGQWFSNLVEAINSFSKTRQTLPR